MTSPARTVFDLARRPGLQKAVIAIDALLRATGITVDDVQPLVVAHPRRADRPDVMAGAGASRSLGRGLPVLTARVQLGNAFPERRRR